MAIKSILQVEVNDSAWKEYQKAFQGYERQLKKMPEAWKQVAAQVDVSKKGFQASVSSLVAGNVQHQLALKAQREADRITGSLVDKWGKINQSVRSTFDTVGRIMHTAVRWTERLGIAGLLGGAAGVWGLDRFATGVMGRQRQAIGLGMQYGAPQAFGVSYRRILENPEGYLQGIIEARTDPTKARALFSLLPGWQKMSTQQTATEFLPAIKRLLDRTPESLVGKMVEAYGLNQHMTLQDALNLRATPQSELGRFRSQFGENVGRFALNRDETKAWADFLSKLETAGNTLETAIIRRLTPLSEPLGKLSEGFTHLVESMLKSPHVAKWIEQLAGGLEAAAKYVGTDKFKDDMEKIGSTIASWAERFAQVSKMFELPTVEITKGGFADRAISGVSNWWNRLPADTFINRHNPGNLRVPGSSSEFQSFSSDDEGVRAIARQLRLYGRRGINTVEDIITKYAPPSENDTAGYIRNVTQRTGFGARDRLDLNDAGTLAKLITAITKQENHNTNFTVGGVKVTIENNTGGATIAQARQVAQ